MPKLAFEFSSLNELHGFCTEFVLNWAKAAEIAKASKPAKAEDVEEKTTKKVKDSEEKAVKKTKEEPEETKVGFDEVRLAMLKLVETDEEDTIPSILEKFGAEKVSQLKEKDFARALDLFTKAYKRSSPVEAKD